MLSRVAKISIWLHLLVFWIPTLTHGIPGATGNSNTYTLPVGVTLKDGCVIPYVIGFVQAQVRSCLEYAEDLYQDGDTYDYIVVGAGAAGCAAAARLALAGLHVLLVEAGGDPNFLTEIPAAAMGLMGSDMDWQYQTVPNNVSCLASRGRQCRFSRGKCLGGSTSINYMLYTRGNRRDYNFNITGWNWADLKPYFLRYEGLQVLNQLPQSSIPYHNTKGILKTEFFDDSQNPWQSRIYRGYRALNFPKNLDVNGVSQIGVSRVVGYVYEGERMSTARAYLGRKDVQRTLKVAKDTLCTGVIIDDDNVTRGITVLPKLATQPLRLYARKEVILSAGTIGTPQILMLSGIGPAKHLRKMGIPVRVNLPVGDNMSDHVLPLIFILVDGDTQVAGNVTSAVRKVGQLGKPRVSRGGPLSSDGLADINAFANTLCYDRMQGQLQNGSADCDLPSLQVIHAYIPRNIITFAKAAFQQGTGLDDDAANQLASANKDRACIVISPIVLAPYSRGKIRLFSSDPKQHPAIFPNYLSDKRDVDEMLRSIQIVEKLVQTPPFKKNNATIVRLKFPGCPSSQRSREEYWRCYVRHMTYAVYHAVGTCSLGAVVDTELRVKGVRGLRVADASIFMRIPRGNTEAPTVAVGERVVDFVMEALGENDIKQK